MFEGRQSESWHASEDELMLYANGELPVRRAARVRAHLQHCWQCRVLAEKNEQVIANVVEFINRNLTPRLPEPPNGWHRFDTQLQRAAASGNREAGLVTLTTRVWHALRGTSAALRIASGTAAVALALLLVVRFQSVRTVSAKELLQRATEARVEGLRHVPKPVVYQKVRINSRGRSFTRTIYRDVTDKRVAQFRNDQESQAGKPRSPQATEVQSSDPLQTLFNRARLDWNDPISAMAFSAWRSGLAQKEDEVTTESNGLVTLRTKTAEGPIAEASLTMRQGDYHPVGEEIVLQDRERVELAELEWQVISLDSLNAAIFAPPTSLQSALPMVPMAAPPQPTAAELDAAELDARVALHAIGADLGDDVEIREERRRVVIEALISSEDRKQQLAAALADIPLVKVHLLTMAEAAAQHPPARSEARPIVMTVQASPLLEQRLQQRFTDGDQRTAFVNDTLALTQDTSARVWALRRLANRYTAAEIGSLDSSARQKLETLLGDHVTALHQDAVRLQRQLDPILTPARTGASPTMPAATPLAQDWREGVKRVHSSVQMVSESVKICLGGAAADSTQNAQEVELQLRSTLAQLRSELEVLRRQLAETTLIPQIRRQP